MITLLFFIALLAAPARAELATDRVVLLHGLGRSSSSMESLEARLLEARFTVHNIDYSSTEGTPEQLLASVTASIDECCSPSMAAPGARLHFVTHSLGGILARAYLARQRPDNMGRAVLLAPPNSGSEIVDAIGDSALFSGVFGPTGQDLGTDPGSFPNRLPPPDYEVGIIAGSRSINPIGSMLIPGPDDGAVSIENSKLEEASGFLVIDATHTFIMHDDEVIRQTIHFLRTGAFDEPEPEPEPEPGD